MERATGHLKWYRVGSENVQDNAQSKDAKLAPPHHLSENTNQIYNENLIDVLLGSQDLFIPTDSKKVQKRLEPGPNEDNHRQSPEFVLKRGN